MIFSMIFSDFLMFSDFLGFGNLWVTIIQFCIQGTFSNSKSGCYTLIFYATPVSYTHLTLPTKA